MKKILFALVVGIGLTVNADYMYWMVEPGVEGKDIQGNAATFNWTDAYLTYEGYAGEGKGIGHISKDDADFNVFLDTYEIASIGSSSDYSSRSYFIELYNGDTWLAASTHKTGSSLSKYIFGDNSMSARPSEAFGFGSPGVTYAVPEPTSGLLFLLGGMLLGLKRRRMA